MNAMTPLSVRVRKKRSEAEDVVSFELVHPEGRTLPPFSAGAHIDVCVKDGVIRQYSLCNHPEQRDRYLIAILREPASRGGSVSMHEDVHEGDLIRISEPRNHFPLVPASRTLLFAGGIGVTPILCMAERLAHTGADFEMHYCTRSAGRTAFGERIRAADWSNRAHFHFDDGADAQKLQLDTLVAQPCADTHIYICGPKGFIDYVLNICRQHGWEAAQLHTEYFAGQAVDTSTDGSFEVCIASTGARFQIPADRTVVNVLLANGIDVPIACEQGVCGTCVTRVLEGIPEHRDMYLTEEEQGANDQFTPCCSRARSKVLVLDL